MKLIISHFYNEEYLLPYWLRHHLELFDHGILIDYHSTDRSVEICRSLAPHWEVVTSQNKTFSAILCDFEVMKHEERYPNDWKLVLNTTEFLVGDEIDATMKHCEHFKFWGARIPYFLMVDTRQSIAESDTLVADQPLVEQLTTGINPRTLPIEALIQENSIWDRFRPGIRDRYFHRYVIGAYTPGRHGTGVAHIVPLEPQQLHIRWLAFSPWSEPFLRRKLQINAQVDAYDREVGNGIQHLDSFREMEEARAMLIPHVSEMYLPYP